MTALIVLAAGNSSRLGYPKQNLWFQNQTLLQRAVKTGLASGCRPLIVMLGANVDAIEINNQGDVEVLYNANWNEGIASSIRMAIKEVEKHKEVHQAIFMLCDQPFVTPALIEMLIQKSTETIEPIIACSYDDTIGVPALFNSGLFPELSLLQGNEGARKILKSHQHTISIVPFKLGSIDIDTTSDYERLCQSTIR
jgi:molybdenum cofactor cytidylyltransferase